jgi:heme exporter protein C
MRLATRLVPVLLIGAALMLIRAPFLIDAAPYESTMGLVQKIFYFHVPSAMVAMTSAMVCGIASVVFLIRRTRQSDHVALAAAELTVVFGLIVLVTGPLWARKAWGAWWVWQDARLTITLVMWMLFAGYLLLRRFGGPGAEVLAAAVAIFGTALVPFVYWSVKIWRTQHPTTDVVVTLPPEMSWPLRWSMMAFALLYTALLIVRTRIENGRAELEDAYAVVED